MDFPPRLTVDPDYQDMMRQEFRRVAARMGMFNKYLGSSTVNHFYHFPIFHYSLF